MLGVSTADSTSVLLKFSSLLEIENYTKVAHLEYNDINNICKLNYKRKYRYN